MKMEAEISDVSVSISQKMLRILCNLQKLGERHGKVPFRDGKTKSM